MQQPPPRRSKAGSNLRNVHNEQFTRIQFKHQVDVDLLEDIRNFTKLRAGVEKEYGQQLLKLSSNFLARKMFTNPEKKGDIGEDNRLAYGVWRTLLDETEKLAKARLAAVEVYNSQISESAKAVRAAKLQVAKKYLDSMRRMQEELQVCVSEVDKTRKLYYEEEHMAHGARDKAHDAEEKLKRKKGRIFQSVTALQKNSAKFSSRREACDIQATKARNDYILALVAANAHQKRFYQTDLPEIIQSLDCGICDRVREYITLMARTELLTCTACQASYSKIQEEAERITGQFTLDCFLRENPVLGNMVQYDFEPCDEDTIEKISVEHNALLCLQKEARKWSSCLTKELRTLRDCHKEVAKIQAQLATGEKVDAVQGEGGGQQMVDLETKLDEMRHVIRRAETSKAKAEARIEALREGGVNVDEWLKAVDIETLAAHDDLCRKGSTSSVGSRFSTRSEPGLEEQAGASSEANDSLYDSDFNDGSSDVSAGHRRTSSLTDSVNAGGNTSVDAADASVDVVEAASPYVVDMQDPLEAVTQAWRDDSPAGFVGIPAEEVTSSLQEETATSDYQHSAIRCVALFNYEAVNPDELSFVEQEELEIIDDKEGDGWIKARNYRGEEGFIPQNYVEPLDEREVQQQEQSGLASFSSVDYAIPGEDDYHPPPDSLDLAPLQDQVSSEGEFCRALYDYEATCEEELSFMEGQVIRILNRVVNEVDDGWWEGDVQGKTGLFPSLVVEELKWDGAPQTPQDVSSPPGSVPPPAFTPPQPLAELQPATTAIILTKPTPETDQPAEVQEGVTVRPKSAKQNEEPTTEGVEGLSGVEAGTSSDDAFQPDAPSQVAICIHSPDQPPRTGSDTEEEEEEEEKKEGAAGDPPPVAPFRAEEQQDGEATAEFQETDNPSGEETTSKTEVEGELPTGSYQTAEEFEKSLQEAESEDSTTDVTIVEAGPRPEFSDSQVSTDEVPDLLGTPEKEESKKDDTKKEDAVKE